MLPTVITSFVLTESRSLKLVAPQKLKEHWEQYLEIRILVMLSLTLQIILIALGGSRKKIRDYRLWILVWCAYLSADAVAIYAVGVLRSEPSLKSNNLLRTFWAPFLLMHLGGPDTMTAYALQDNELWLRHCLTLVTQAVITLYILFQTWNGSYISWFYVVILICGLIKYSERVWALWAASSETFRDSTPERHQRIPKMLERQKLKQAEGHVAVIHQVIELHQTFDYNIVGLNWVDEEKDLSTKELYRRRQEEIRIARRMIEIFRPAFTDQLLSFDDAASAKSTLEKKHYLSVFNIIAIELGFIYDLLYTKAMLFQSPWGYASRMVTLSLTTITLIVFTSLSGKEASKYTKTDLRITFVLVVAAVFLELCGFLLQHLFSDKFISWLINHKHSCILRIVNCLRPLSKRQRWSGKIGQFSLLSYSLKEKHYLGHLEIRGLQRHFYMSHLNVQDVLKKSIYNHIKEIPDKIYGDLQSSWDVKWKDDKEKKQQMLMIFQLPIWKQLQFDMCILIWHIATDICCHARKDNADAEVSLDLSRYMLHLLVRYPYLLPAGIGRIKFKDMHSMMTTFFEQNELDHTDPCSMLLKQVESRLNSTVTSSDKSKFVMFNGCHLASHLEKIKDDIRFELLRETWIGLLVLAALQCKANYHLQHLRYGGELLTHVWLLLVHFGFTDHFKIPNNVEIAELIIK